MAGWNPFGTMTYSDFLTRESLGRDITGKISDTGKSLQKQITTNISKQTSEIVASNNALMREFGTQFDSVNNTLAWGFKNLENAVTNVEWAIEDLRADFNYNMGLLLNELLIQNELLGRVVDRLDAIHGTLNQPLLTQARELYKIGIDRLKRKLLDKALEAFLEAEKKNDTDFFTQLQIGNLYLSGIDEDDNVVDLEKAKKHLLLAARYAKSELNFDETFYKFAAEALFKASLAIYFQLNNSIIEYESEKAYDMVNEAKKFASEAFELNPNLIEALYHITKYDAILGNTNDSINNLGKCISTDRLYAIKAATDGGFNRMKDDLITYLSELKKQEKEKFIKKIAEAEKQITDLQVWSPANSSISNIYNYYDDVSKYKLAKQYGDSDTYLDYCDALDMLQPIIVNFPIMKEDRIREIRSEIGKVLTEIRAISSLKEEYTDEIDENIAELNDLYEKIKEILDNKLKEKHNEALEFVRTAKKLIIEIETEKKEIDDEERREKNKLEQKQRERERRQKRRDESSKERAKGGAIVGGIIGLLTGCVECVGNISPIEEGFAAIRYLFINAFFGVLIGTFLGYLIGQFRK